MAVAQLYTAAPGDTITAARWNNEFGNIYNNGTALAFPATTAISLNGQTLTLDSAGVVSLAGSAGAGILTGDFSVSGNLKATAALGFYIQGLIQSNGTDAVNDIDISIGMATSNDAVQANRRTMTLTSVLTKQLDAAWAVGSGGGGLDTGAIGNSNYYVWLIMRSDTGVVDALFSLSSTAPTMPTNYTYKRLIGWFIRVGGTIVAFKAYEMSGGGLQYLWSVPTADINLANTLGTTARLDTIRVPVNFSVLADITVGLDDAAALMLVQVTCPDIPDIAVGNAGMQVKLQVIGSTSYEYGYIRTSATGQIRSKCSVATADSYVVITNDFIWDRRN